MKRLIRQKSFIHCSRVKVRVSQRFYKNKRINNYYYYYIIIDGVCEQPGIAEWTSRHSRRLYLSRGKLSQVGSKDNGTQGRLPILTKQLWIIIWILESFCSIYWHGVGLSKKGRLIEFNGLPISPTSKYFNQPLLF